jgi:hypothetical protein
MFGFAPLGSLPLGGFPSQEEVTVESTGGGASPIPQVIHDMRRYTKRWFEKDFLRAYARRKEDFAEEFHDNPLQALLAAKLEEGKD